MYDYFSLATDGPSSPQSHAVTSPTSVAETVDSADISQRSLADSGNYDDLLSPCVSVKVNKYKCIT